MPFKKKNSKKRLQVSGKQSHRPRYIYQQRTKIELQCRVCLTVSNNVMYDLNNNTAFNSESENGFNDYYKHVSIREVLQKVTSTKVVLKEAYPQYICPICLSFLKMALKFILQFEESQIKIDKILGIHLSESKLDDENGKFKWLDKETEGLKNGKNRKDVTPVEIIYGENKFSLSDLILVEEEEKERNNFSGFLRNLGKEVSASFTDKSRENKVETAESTGVSITVIEKNRLLPVKEIELIEETDEIKFVIEDVNDTFTAMEGEELFEVVADEDYPEDANYVPEEDSSEQVDDSKKMDYIEMDMSNIDSFIIEHGKDSSDDRNKENSIGEIHKTKRCKKEDFDISHSCELCKKIYSSERHLKAHKRRTHSTNVMTYMCDICGYKNNTLSAHNHHKTKHIGKKWVCNICKKPYYTKAVLKVHMQSHINKRQHLCSVCGKGFNYANALEYHMRLHTGEKKYECHLCSQRFRMPNSLKRHLRTHTGEKPYKCQYCAKPFFSKSEVSAHELIHMDYRPYICSYCAKGFTKSHNMKVHLLSHSGSHRCNLCARSFIDATILQMHYKMIHKKDAVKFEESSDDQEMLDSGDIEAFIK